MNKSKTKGAAQRSAASEGLHGTSDKEINGVAREREGAMDAAAAPPTTTEKEVSSRDYIPEDVAFFILSKLPLKSLKRFECVRKLWTLLFENTHFMTIYRNNFISKLHSHSYREDNTSLLLHHHPPFVNQHPHNSSLYTLFGERYENRVKLDWPAPFHEDHPTFHFSDSNSINGTFCLYAIQTKEALLWNLATKEFKILPPSSVESIPPYRRTWIDIHGYGYDSLRDDYKVIRHVTFIEFNDSDVINYGMSLDDFPWDDLSYDPPVWEIYSLRSNSWRILDVDMPTYCGAIVGSRLYMDGMCYWWGNTDPINSTEDSYLVSFDLSNETFFTTPIPSDDDTFDIKWVQRHLAILNGSIALISYCTDTFHISILGKIGVIESWTKLFVIGPLPCIEDLIGVGNNGVLFFIKKDDELAWVDLRTQIIEELGIKGRRLISHIINYKEGILPIEGMRN